MQKGIAHTKDLKPQSQSQSQSQSQANRSSPLIDHPTTTVEYLEQSSHHNRRSKINHSQRESDSHEQGNGL